MIWFLLILAGLLEVAWTIGLKLSAGFSRPFVSLFTLLALLLSVFLLGLAMRSLPVGTAYAIWVGVGIIGTALARHLLFAEPIRLTGVLSMGLIFLGIVGLKLSI